MNNFYKLRLKKNNKNKKKKNLNLIKDIYRVNKKENYWKFKKLNLIYKN